MALWEPDQLERNETMDPKLNNVVASGLAFAGALGIYFGLTDESTWAGIAGGLSTIIAFVLPFVLPHKTA